jgi:hypothetical protein
MALPLGVINPMRASGGCAPVSLIELGTASGKLYLYSEQDAIATSSKLTVGGVGNYRGWVVGQPRFSIYGSTQTDTGSVSIQNLSGDTVMRDVSAAFAKQEFIGAFFYYRLWRGDAEQALFTFVGNVSDVEVSETEMTLTIESFGNWSAIKAPAYDIDVSCPLFFGSQACGSTSSTICQNSYGTCTSIERFAGVIIQYTAANLIAPVTQLAQPAPIAAYNPARPF